MQTPTKLTVWQRFLKAEWSEVKATSGKTKKVVPESTTVRPYCDGESPKEFSLTETFKISTEM